MRSFRLNINGRVNNFPSFKSQPLMPVFEAVVNSFHAISERKKTDKNFHGKIYIEIQRAMCTDELPPIENVFITDNGIGFNENNLNSFLEADSNYKSEYGCKGVGRFSWLQAFDQVDIESNYCDGDGYYARNIAFQLNKNEYTDEEISPKISSLLENVTKVKLISYKKAYQKGAPKRLDIIANKIISHCLMYFMGNDCPEVLLNDENESLNLVDKFHEKVKLEGKESYKIKNSDFVLQHAKVDESFQTGHLLYLCANDRLVSTRDLVKEISDLSMPLGEKEYYYVGILTSHYLDQNVDPSRLSFVSIPEVAQENMFEVISMSNIVEEAATIISNYLKTDIEPLRKNKIALIQDFMRSTEGIGYRYLMKHCPEKVEAIPPGLSSEKLDLELYRIKKEFDDETKSSLNKIITQHENIDPESYKKIFESNMDRVTDSSSSHLAEYIAHRKTILDLFENSLNIKEDGKYSKESYIHDIIFPRGTSLDELPVEKHNLWLIDEKLSYYFYATSDIPFNNDRGERRPDILFFDKPIAFVDEKNDGTPYETVVIFELKRPMRANLERNEDPISQVLDYVIKIKNKELTDVNGRPIKVSDNTQFYVYVVCDVDKALESKLNVLGFRKTPDGLGYYDMDTNIHKEILSFDKILNDSTKRNRILFDKLNLI